jgi:hypothetical protein
MLSPVPTKAREEMLLSSPGVDVVETVREAALLDTLLTGLVAINV